MSGEKHENPKSEKQPVGRLKIEMQVEELEPIEAPSSYLNSNETQPAAIIASAKAIFGTSFETWKTGPVLRQVVALIVFDSSAEPALAGARKTGSTAPGRQARSLAARGRDAGAYRAVWYAD